MSSHLFSQATSKKPAFGIWRIGGVFLGLRPVSVCSSLRCGTHLFAVRTCLREHFDNAVAVEKIKPETKWGKLEVPLSVDPVAWD